MKPFYEVLPIFFKCQGLRMIEIALVNRYAEFMHAGYDPYKENTFQFL